MDVPCSSTAAAELAAPMWQAALEDGRWATSVRALGGLGSSEGIPCATAAGMDKGACSWVRFHDGISRWHIWVVFAL